MEGRGLFVILHLRKGQANTVVQAQTPGGTPALAHSPQTCMSSEVLPGRPWLSITCSSRSSIKSHSSPYSPGWAPWLDTSGNQSGLLSLSTTHTAGPSNPWCGDSPSGQGTPAPSAGYQVDGEVPQEHQCHHPGLAGPSAGSAVVPVPGSLWHKATALT